MPLSPIKGVITSLTYAKDKVGVEWEIPNFFSATLPNDNWDSPPFLFLNAEWCIRLILNVGDDADWWRSLHLVMRNPSSCYTVIFTLGIRRLAVPCTFGPEVSIFDKTCNSHGPEKLFQRHIIQRVDPYDNSLVVYCDVAENLSSTACQTTLLNSTTILCRDFQDLLLSGRNSDVTITVRGQDFKAHKLILGARSPVFAAMFEHDMAENKENVIKVEDCDPNIFLNFLLCVYGGRVESLTVDEAIRLYIVSHKYAVVDIMGKCAQLMEEELSEDKVCDILALAHRYDETGLKNSAEEYLTQNFKKVFPTNNWSTLMAESSLLEKYS